MQRLSTIENPEFCQSNSENSEIKDFKWPKVICQSQTNEQTTVPVIEEEQTEFHMDSIDSEDRSRYIDLNLLSLSRRSVKEQFTQQMIKTLQYDHAKAQQIIRDLWHKNGDLEGLFITSFVDSQDEPKKWQKLLKWLTGCKAKVSRLNSIEV